MDSLGIVSVVLILCGASTNIYVFDRMHRLPARDKVGATFLICISICNLISLSITPFFDVHYSIAIPAVSSLAVCVIMTYTYYVAFYTAVYSLVLFMIYFMVPGKYSVWRSLTCVALIVSTGIVCYSWIPFALEDASRDTPSFNQTAEKYCRLKSNFTYLKPDSVVLVLLNSAEIILSIGWPSSSICILSVMIVWTVWMRLKLWKPEQSPGELECVVVASEPPGNNQYQSLAIGPTAEAPQASVTNMRSVSDGARLVLVSMAYLATSTPYRMHQWYRFNTGMEPSLSREAFVVLHVAYLLQFVLLAMLRQ